MIEVSRKIKTAKDKAKGEPILRVGRETPLFITGLDEYSSIELISPKGTISAHITLHHLDRLGNGNYAAENDPHLAQYRTHIYEHKRDAYGPVDLRLSRKEAVALWALLDRVKAQAPHLIQKDEAEPIRWAHERLATRTQEVINRDK